MRPVAIDTYAECCIYKLSKSAFRYVTREAEVDEEWHVCRTRYELSIASDTEMENGEGQVSALRSIYAEADAHGFVFSVVVVY